MDVCWRKAKKRNATYEASAVAAINRSDRAVARSCVDTVSRRAVRFFFFIPVSAAASIPKRTARDEMDVARGREESGEKKRDKERKRKRETHVLHIYKYIYNIYKYI